MAFDPNSPYAGFDPSMFTTVMGPDGNPVQIPSSIADRFGPPMPDQMTTTLGPRGQGAPPPGMPQAPPQPPPPPPPPVTHMPMLPGELAKASSPVGGAQHIGQTGPAGTEIAALQQPPAALPQKPIAPAGTGGIPTFAPTDPGMPGATASTPPEKPVATADLRNGSTADVLNKETTANASADKAGAQLADEQAAFQSQMADAYHQRNAEIDKDTAAKAQAAQANLDAINKKAASIDSAIEAYSNMKIDRSVDHPILAAIGLAMGALGAAMTKSNENPAFAALQNQIKNKVETQLANKQGALQTIGLQRDSLGDLRQQFTDRNAYYDGLMAAETKRTIALGDELSARSQSKQVQANWQLTRAQLQEKQAQSFGQAVDKQHAQDQAKAAYANERADKRFEQGIQAQTIGQADRHFEESQQQARAFHADEMKSEADKLAAAGNKAGAAEVIAQQQKLNNDGFMAPSGVVKQADGTLKPHFEFMTQEDGKTPYIAPEKAQEKLREKYDGTIKAIDALDNLRRLRKENGGDINKWSADAREKVAEYERALVGAHQAAGISGFKGNVMEVMDKQLSGGADPTATLASVLPLLDNARGNLQKDLNGSFRAANYTGKQIEFHDPLNDPRPVETDTSKQRGTLETPVPNAIDNNNIMLTLHDAEQNARSDDPEVKQKALNLLDWTRRNAPDPHTRKVAGDVFGHYVVGRPPLLPDPNKYPEYYGVKR